MRNTILLDAVAVGNVIRMRGIDPEVEDRDAFRLEFQDGIDEYRVAAVRLQKRVSLSQIAGIEPTFPRDPEGMLVRRGDRLLVPVGIADRENPQVIGDAAVHAVNRLKPLLTGPFIPCEDFVADLQLFDVFGAVSRTEGG